MLEKTSGGAAAGRTTRTASPGKLGMDDAEASWWLVEPFIGKQQAQFTAWIRPCWKRSPVPLPAHLHPLSLLMPARRPGPADLGLVFLPLVDAAFQFVLLN